jgi:hypothetical protein
VAAEAAGNAVLAINPKLLIFVEGIDCYNGSCDWQGGNLVGVATNPVTLSVANQLVYSAHDYGPNLYRQPWFTNSTTDTSLDAVWNKYWGYISAAGTAPVWVGEFGTDNSSTDIQSTVAGSQGQWFEGLVAYIQTNSTLNWTYWALNGEDDYALLDSNYDVTPLSVTKQSMLAAMQFPLTGGGGLACPVPTVVPTNFTGTAASSSQINLSWTAVPESAPGCTITYDIFSSTTQGFTPSSSNLIASGVTGTTYSDTGLTASTQYYFAAETVDVTGATQPSSILSVETLAGSSTGSFTLAPSASSLSLTQGGSATDTITVTDTGGFTGSVAFTATGLPSGVTASFSPASSTSASVLTLTASSTATTGAATLTITGTSGSTTAKTTIALTVNPLTAPGFTLTPSAASLSVAQGKTGADTITVTDAGGFTGSVTLAASGLPTGVTAAFATNPTTGTSVLTFTASSTAAAGSSTVTITGTSGSTTAKTTIALTITTSTPSFTLAPSAATLPVTQGKTATDTITVTGANGFTGSVTLAASGLPTGVTAAFATNPTTATSVLTFTASAAATAGTSTVTVTGTSGSTIATTTIALTVASSSPSTCTVDYVISPQNTSAFGAAITILNTGTTAWTSWTLTWTFANGQTVSSLWNGIETQSGANVTVKNESYNGSIAAGGSLTGVGFNGTWNGASNAVPTAFSINGTACTVN